ncbi:MAG: PorP/SprF family type IX secretion system membrane protein, partial [Bacteroidota bacterium]
APAFNPALTGIEEYLDVKVGYRKQWTGFTDAPETFYASAYGTISASDKYSVKRYSLRVSNPKVYNPVKPRFSQEHGIRHGVGGYVLRDAQGPFEYIEGFLNYAFHFPVNDQLYVSLGASVGVSNNRIDFDKLTVRDQNDDVYQALLMNGGSSTFVDANVGIGVYASGFYLSYSAAQVARQFVFGNEVLENDENSIQHNFIGGFRFVINPDVILQPAVFARVEQGVPLTYDLNFKARLKGRYWLGASYRNDQTIIGMLGFTFNNVNFGYSYDYNTQDISDFNNGSHEITLGLMLFNTNNFLPYLW